MDEPKFLEHRVKRWLDAKGLEYTFQLMGVDEYNQPVASTETVIIKGIYHELNSFVSIATSDAARVQRKKSPMILTLKSSDTDRLHQGDVLILSGEKYSVSSVLDVQNYGVVVDISLEVQV